MQILKITCIATFCLDFFSGLNDDTLLIPTKVKSNCQQERKQNRSSHELVSLTWSLWSIHKLKLYKWWCIVELLLDDVYKWSDLSTCRLLFQSKSKYKCVGFAQSRYHHLIKCNLFSPWYSWKITHLALYKNYSLQCLLRKTTIIIELLVKNCLLYILVL